MNTFYVYKKNEEFVFVKESFSVYAFMFNAIWLLINKSWSHCLFIAIALIFSNYLYMIEYFSYIQVFLCRLAISLYCGFSATNLKCNTFANSGFDFETVVFAKSEIEAKLEFYKNVK